MTPIMKMAKNRMMMTMMMVQPMKMMMQIHVIRMMLMKLHTNMNMMAKMIKMNKKNNKQERLIITMADTWNSSKTSPKFSKKNPGSSSGEESPFLHWVVFAVQSCWHDRGTCVPQFAYGALGEALENQFRLEARGQFCQIVRGGLSPNIAAQYRHPCSKRRVRSWKTWVARWISFFWPLSGSAKFCLVLYSAISSICRGH